MNNPIYQRLKRGSNLWCCIRRTVCPTHYQLSYSCWETQALTTYTLEKSCIARTLPATQLLSVEASYPSAVSSLPWTTQILSVCTETASTSSHTTPSHSNCKANSTQMTYIYHPYSILQHIIFDNESKCTNNSVNKCCLIMLYSHNPAQMTHIYHPYSYHAAHYLWQWE